MKRLFALFTACIMIITFTACSKAKLSLEHDFSDKYKVKVDYADKYKVNDEYVEMTASSGNLPDSNITIYDGEKLLAKVIIYDGNNSSTDMYSERIEQIKKYADPNREKTPAEQYTSWKILEDKEEIAFMIDLIYALQV